MAVPTDEQIQQWRDRWTLPHTKHLPGKIAEILKGDGPARSDLEAVMRMWQVNQVLEEHNTDGLYEIDHFDSSVDLEKIKFPLMEIVPRLDLRGIQWSGTNLDFVVLCGCLLTAAQLDKTTMQYSDLQYSKMNNILIINSNLSYSNLALINFSSSIFLDTLLIDCNFSRSSFQGSSLYNTVLYKSNFRFINTDSNHRHTHNNNNNTFLISSPWFIPKYTDIIFSFIFNVSIFKNLICYIDNKLLEHNELSKHIDHYNFSLTLFKPISTVWISIRRGWYYTLPLSWIITLFFNRWFFTNFQNVDIDKCDTTEAGDLVRYIKDQQYLRAFKQKHPLFYWFWNLTTNCGYSASRVAVLGVVIILAFAALYMHAPFETPDFMLSLLGSTPLTDWLVMRPYETLVNPDMVNARYPDTLSDFARFFFVSFDIFTNLGVRSTHPACNAGVVAVFFETVAGFMSLGLMIAVLTNKYARRS